MVQELFFYTGWLNSWPFPDHPLWPFLAHFFWPLPCHEVIGEPPHWDSEPFVW